MGITSIFEFVMGTCRENEIADTVTLIIIMLGLGIVAMAIVRSFI